LPKQTTHKSGKIGEDAALRYLGDNGFLAIARNFHSPTGEVDIIALDHGELVFTEVKRFRTYSIESIETAVGKKKRQRIIETAKYFLLKYRQYSNAAIRFDVVFIGATALIHLPGAFVENI
jgi:putative endonuclease